MAHHPKPDVGMRVSVKHWLEDRYEVGTVIDLLAVQFTFARDDGLIRYCHYTGPWSERYD